MNIGFVRRHFRFGGGGEKAIENYLNEYVNSGWDVTLITESWKGEIPECVQMRKIDSYGGRVATLRSFTQGVEELLRKNNFDCVQSHEWIPSGVDILRLGDGLHSFWVDVLSGQRGGLAGLLLKFSKFHKLKIQYEKEALLQKKLKKIVVNSLMVEEQLRAYYPTLDIPVTVRRNVVSEKFYEPGLSLSYSENHGDTLRLVFVGNGWERKQLSLCLEAVSSCGFTRMDIYGDDKNRQRFKRLAYKYSCADRVNFCGVKPLSVVDYWRYDVLLAPSLYDPFPNAVAEALVSNLKVITSSNCGGIDFVDHETVFPANTAEEISRCLVEIAHSTPAVSKPGINEKFQRIFS